MSSVQQSSATDGSQVQDPMNATMTNNTRVQMDLLKFKNWAGTPDGAFPSAILPGELASFTHLKAGAMGSVAAVVYSGFNTIGNQCAWVLAWDAPTYPSSATPKRVYVDCGQLGLIDSIPWDQIRMNLGVAPESTYARDVASQTTVKAKFDEKIPDPATIEASFDLMNP